jgi:hypothetical protein
MNIDDLEQRQAVAAWRDRLTLAAWELINAAGSSARDEVETNLPEASLLDTLMNPARFVYDRVDVAMHLTLATRLKTLFEQAAQELQAINPAYQPLASALIASVDVLSFPSTQAEAQEETELSEHAPSRWFPRITRLPTLPNYVVENRLAKGAVEVGSRALDVLGGASSKLQSGTGLHDRLRKAAAGRITQAWMGTRGAPRPLMGQLISMIDEVTNEARSMAL